MEFGLYVFSIKPFFQKWPKGFLFAHLLCLQMSEMAHQAECIPHIVLMLAIDATSSLNTFLESSFQFPNCKLLFGCIGLSYFHLSIKLTQCLESETAFSQYSHLFTSALERLCFDIAVNGLGSPLPEGFPLLILLHNQCTALLKEMVSLGLCHNHILLLVVKSANLA